MSDKNNQMLQKIKNLFILLKYNKLETIKNMGFSDYSEEKYFSIMKILSCKGSLEVKKKAIHLMGLRNWQKYYSLESIHHLSYLVIFEYEKERIIREEAYDALLQQLRYYVDKIDLLNSELPDSAMQAICVYILEVTAQSSEANIGSLSNMQLSRNIVSRIKYSKISIEFIKLISEIALNKEISSDKRNEATIILKNMADDKCYDTLNILSNDKDVYISENAKSGLSELPVRQSAIPSINSSDDLSVTNNNIDILTEINLAISAIENARSQGLTGAAKPLRTTGIQIMRFLHGQKQKFRMHLELLTELVRKELLEKYDICKLELGGEGGFSGLLFIMGKAEDMVKYASYTYYLQEAEKFVAQQCGNDWSKIDASSTVSDIPAAKCKLDLNATEKSLRELASLVSHYKDKIVDLTILKT